MSPVMTVENLSVAYSDFTLHPITLSMERGEILAIAGESGSGKTTFAKGVSCLLGSEAAVSGRVTVNGLDVTAMTEDRRKELRMADFSVVFQNSSEWLNPSLRLHQQLSEVLIKKHPVSRHMELMQALMTETGLDPEDLNLYPKQLSGGMAQKFLLASAIALRPKLVILDEPTSSVDAAYRKEFVSLIRGINREYGTAFLLITHDLRLAEELSQKLVVLYRGHIVESGVTSEIINEPRHPYTRGLVSASVSLNIVRDMWGIRPGPVSEQNHKGHGCPFSGRCTQAIDICETNAPELTRRGDGRSVACNRGGIVNILYCENVTKSFGKNTVLKDISLFVRSGEIVSLIGRSGAGKTTLSLILGGFLSGSEDGAKILFDQTPADFQLLHKSAGGIQMVFQDSEEALNPAMRAADAVAEPLRLAGEPCGEDILRAAFRDVGLTDTHTFMHKPVRALSHGERQRVSIARAISMRPRLLIADEPTSMLDPSSKANLLRMLKRLQNQIGFSMLIVTHDLDSAAKISDRIFLLKNGRLSPVKPMGLITESRQTLYDA